MKLFTGLIKCGNCGCNYNFKNDHNNNQYFICSKTKNKGVKFCPRCTIKPEDIIYLIENHIKIYHPDKKIEEGIGMVDKIIVGLYGEIEVRYKNGRVSISNSNNIIF